MIKLKEKSIKPLPCPCQWMHLHQFHGIKFPSISNMKCNE